MAKKGYISARIDPQIKHEVDAILGSVGVSTTVALTMFFHQIILHRGLPFEVRMPPREQRRQTAVARRTGRDPE